MPFASHHHSAAGAQPAAQAGAAAPYDLGAQAAHEPTVSSSVGEASGSVPEQVAEPVRLYSAAAAPADEPGAAVESADASETVDWSEHAAASMEHPAGDASTPAAEAQLDVLPDAEPAAEPLVEVIEGAAISDVAATDVPTDTAGVAALEPEAAEEPVSVSSPAGEAADDAGEEPSVAAPAGSGVGVAPELVDAAGS
jgi:hypothetical protein